MPKETNFAHSFFKYRMYTTHQMNRQMKMFKNYLFFTSITLLMFVSTFTLADGPKAKAKSAKWASLTKTNLLAVDYRYEECKLPSQGTDQEIVYLHLKNLTNQSISVSYNLLKYYNGKCLNCDGREEGTAYTFELKPKATLQGSCGQNTQNGLCIFSKMLNVEAESVLTNFEITNLKVEVK